LGICQFFFISRELTSTASDAAIPCSPIPPDPYALLYN
jgi:hypothetical protein